MPKQPSKTNNDFFERVFEIVRQVPHGRVTNYGAIARYLGTARSSRMVGWAMNQSHGKEPFVPAHRVVNRNGLLTGKAHFPHPDMMQELLESEGIEIDDDKVVDFKRLLWDPGKEF
jgi:methylated-DNA-protein-cysteine methyltransferase related protein